MHQQWSYVFLALTHRYDKEGIRVVFPVMATRVTCPNVLCIHCWSIEENLPITHCQYYGCWWPGYDRNQGINRRVSQMQAPLVACRELAGSYNWLFMVLYVFEHKSQHVFIHAPYTRIKVFWHVNNIPQGFGRVKFVIIPPSSNICEIFLYNQNLAVITFELIQSFRLLIAMGKNHCETRLLSCYVLVIDLCFLGCVWQG